MKRRRFDDRPRLEMMPLIDVVFILLVVFIFSMLTMVRSYVIPVDLPIIGSGEVSDFTSVLVVSVEPDGRVSVGGEPISERDLTLLVQERNSTESDLSVLINADREARHGDVSRVLDSIRQAGSERVLLVAQEAETQRGEERER